jgi:hypothetical protein
MKGDKEAILDRATRALRADVPDNHSISASANRSAVALGIATGHPAIDGAIQGCDQVRRFFESYRDSSLPPSRKLLVDAHLRECGACLRVFREGPAGSAVNWSRPKIESPLRRGIAWGWAAAVFATLVVAGLFVYKAYFQIPPGVRAEVQSINGSAYLIDGSRDRRLAPGATLDEGKKLRTAGDSQAVLRLADGSVVEVNQRSIVAIDARGHNMTVHLSRGDLIVQAAKRSSGHLYVKTPDCRVAVNGTVFSVGAGIKGSRVAVLEGSVHVAHAGTDMVLRPGEQMATGENLAPEPIERQFTWSPEREKYVGMMAQLANVEHRMAQIPFPEPRYSSDLLARVPIDTQLYISVPNLGDFLKEANGVFQDQLNASPELREWWTKGHERNPDQLDEFIGKINDISQYLGNEVVFIGRKQGDRSTLAMVADVKRSGLQDELQQQFGAATAKLVVLNQASLAAAAGAADAGQCAYALVRDHEIVFANSVTTLTQLNAQLDTGPSGFAGTDFGKQIAAAYGRGAGIILGANIHSILETTVHGASHGAREEQTFEASGLADLRYLIAEHRETNGAPTNHLDLQFTGTRQRVASWLADPGPIGSLEFVTPNAAFVFATLTKDPAAIADDMMAMASHAEGGNWSEIDNKLKIDVRNDLVANLGGDFALALDGPVLPTPSWKMVIEVNNPMALENALERMVQAIQGQTQGTNQHVLGIESSTVDSVPYYALRDMTAGKILAEYTFAEGFMVLAPNRALVMDALRTHANGTSLAHASSFRTLLPRDENENYSSLVYQNLSPVLTPLLSQFSGDAADAIQKLASDSRPTVICAWGKENRIEAASDSRLFGFDFLTLGTIVDSRNKPTSQSVLH